jgi:hypothetical protein
MYGPMALFEPDGESFVPTELSRGPWRDDALHGGPIAGLVVRAAERDPAAEGTHVARATIELLRPAYFAPLTARVEVVRAGKTIRLFRVELHAADGLVTAASVLTVAAEEVPLPAELAPTPLDDRPGDGTPAQFFDASDTVRFHSHAVEIRLIEGSLAERGPATAWFRLRTELVAGEDPTPAQRAAVIADLSGIGSVLPFDQYSFPNADLTVHLNREPIGEWVRLSSVNAVGPRGVGLTSTTLADTVSLVGQVEQTQIIRALS